MSLSLPRTDVLRRRAPAALVTLARRRALAIGLAALAAPGLSACADEETRPEGGQCAPPGAALPYETLSEYCFFEGEMRDLSPAERAFEYQVAAPLWSDHAEKQRLIVLPEGGKITFDENEDWVYPNGTIMVKTFSFRDDFRDAASPRRTLETRLLLLGEAGWTGEVYQWNDAMTEATRIVAGDRVDVTYTDEDGVTTTEEYIVPNQNQCKSCHERSDATTFLGPFTHQLNMSVDAGGQTVNQLEIMAERGMFDGAIPDAAKLPAFPDPFGDAPVEERARGYLHANCSHCHRPGGGGGPSGLVLLGWETTPGKNGICKESAAAGPGTGGHTYDIVPGAPDDSIMIYRMESTDPEIKMPELPNRVPDEKGIAVVRDWISSLEPPGCGQ